MTYRQSWSARIQLEAACHDHSAFFTLTYSNDFLPDPPQLSPKDLQLFLKRLRRRLEPRRIRFFACGEYGSKTLRPHYHGVLFGVEANNELEKIISASWVDSSSGSSLGFIQVGPITPARAAYVAKYVCKDVSEDEKIPEGWQKEFARMSNRPGIGAEYGKRFASAVNKQNEKQEAAGYPAVTQLLGGSMRIGPVFYPVARYLRTKLKEWILLGHQPELAAALERQREFYKKIRDEGFVDPRSREGQKVVRANRKRARAHMRKSKGVL